MHSQITIHTFTGRSLSTYLPNIARLRAEVFRERPYLREDNLDYEMRVLQRYSESREAIAVMVFDASMLIGASTGIPLEEEAEHIQRPFLEQHLDPASFFYFSDSALLKQYRGRGIGHHFFDLREAHARQLKQCLFTCFCAIEDKESHLHNFWRKRGYVHRPELRASLAWKNIGEEQETEKSMSFWIKEF